VASLTPDVARPASRVAAVAAVRLRVRDVFENNPAVRSSNMSHQHDDVLAIGLAKRHADIVGITTVGGNSTLANTTRNALIATEVFDLDVPVHTGADRPISAVIQRHPTEAHGTSGLDGPELWIPTRTPASHDAVGFIIEQARTRENLWLIALGPLTNIALALRQAPDIANHIAGISLMGGSLTGGNSTPAAEFNIWFDADAAAEVFAATDVNPGLQIRMCGLDLTAQVGADATFVERLTNTPTRAAKFCEELMVFYRAFSIRLAGLNPNGPDNPENPDNPGNPGNPSNPSELVRAAAVRAPLFDPCAVLAVTHPELFVMNRRHVVVETEGRHTRGMTVADLRPWANPADANVTVVEQADSASCVETILCALTE
jgi:inosine-uridine nucleoside N-ribohydrolase